MADFSTWQRESLEKLVTELLAENQALREVNRAVLHAWRAEVLKKYVDELLNKR